MRLMQRSAAWVKGLHTGQLVLLCGVAGVAAAGLYRDGGVRVDAAAQWVSWAGTCGDRESCIQEMKLRAEGEKYEGRLEQVAAVVVITAALATVWVWFEGRKKA